MNKIRRLLLYVPMLALASCIQNDIPYPVVAIDILEIKGEGFTCTASDIDAKLRTVTLHLDEATDISRVPITEIVITEGGSVSGLRMDAEGRAADRTHLHRRIADRCGRVRRRETHRHRPRPDGD